MHLLHGHARKINLIPRRVGAVLKDLEGKPETPSNQEVSPRLRPFKMARWKPNEESCSSASAGISRRRR